MVQRSSQMGLGTEAFNEPCIVAELLVEQLHRHHATQRDVFGLENHGRRALPDRGYEAIAIRKDASYLVHHLGIGHPCRVVRPTPTVAPLTNQGSPNCADPTTEAPVCSKHMLDRPFIRRFGVPLLAALAVGAFAAMIFAAQGNDNEAARDEAVVELIPNDGDEVLAQSSVGAVLEPGYAVELTINGTVIPPEQIREVDGTFVFRPDEGNAITALRAETNCALISYWPVAIGPNESKSTTWCFTAS